MSRILHRYKIYMVTALVSLLLWTTGCSRQQPAVGNPIEPLVLGESSGETQTVQGMFSIKSADIQIHDLSVTADGTLAAAGSASRSAYLLEQDGRLRWEKSFLSQPIKTYLDPAGRFMVIGTSLGELVLLNIDGTIRFEQNFNASIASLSVSSDGEWILIGFFSSESQDINWITLLDKDGQIRWEAPFEEILAAKIVGDDNSVFINYRQEGTEFLAAFDGDGKEIWKITDCANLSVDDGGQTLAVSREDELAIYNSKGQKLWQYRAEGPVRQIVMAASGLFVGALISDVATQQQDFLYFNNEGELLWSKRLPDDSDVLVSANGKQILVSSWRQYRDDATQILVYNDKGTEVSAFEVAGRTRRMALAASASMLVLGLEDGSIYFLNISKHTASSEEAAALLPQRLQDYYAPVYFEREEGESLLTLFFFEETAQLLVPVTRRIKRTQSLLRPSITELIRGPVQGSQLQRTIPKDAQISAITKDGIVLVDLPASLDGMGGTTFLMGVLDSLLLTISQFPTVEQIRFTVDGEDKETFGQEGILIDKAYNPRRFGREGNEHLLFIPISSGTRMYLLPVSKELLPLKERALAEALVTHILNESADFLPDNVKLNSVDIHDNVVALDFNDEFASIVAENLQAAALAAALRDAFALSIAENLPYVSVRITANGKQLPQPAEFLPWQLTLSRPYFINLED